MDKEFEIIEVPADAPLATEPMGSRSKFWYMDSKHERTLFKEARAATGEAWAEKTAAELAGLLGIPHATIELATWRGKLGTVSPSFVPDGMIHIPGNELLSVIVPGYPDPQAGSVNKFRVKEQGPLKNLLPSARVG